MKVSYHWLKSLINLTQTPEEVAVLLTGSGLEVEGLENSDSVKGGLKGLIIAEVVEKQVHPNADRLSVTKVNTGNGDALQVVCGAPNVAAGQKVVFAPVGSTVHPSNGESFEIKEAKIRGEVSQGMICAEDEIGLGSSHDGIMVLPQEATIGQSAALYFKVESDTLIEIGLTANRGDAASHLGVARELAALTGIPVSKPEVNLPKSTGDSDIKIKIDNPDDCKRYAAIHLKNVNICDSPAWLKQRLEAIGIKPMNNVVDATNYVLHELGQPIHAFDVANIEGKEIKVKKSTNGHKIVTLDGVERKLDGSELMIYDSNGPIAIAGVFGGLNSGVSASTCEVLIESAAFNATLVRKSAKKHGLNTDASFRFERGTDINMCDFAARRAASLIMSTCDAHQVGEIFDFYPQHVSQPQITFRPSRLYAIAGMEIPTEEVKLILSSLEIKLLRDMGEEWLVSIPTYRTDVLEEIDLIEEILRIYGYDKIPFTGKISISMPTFLGHNWHKTEKIIRNFLISRGFSEIMTNSLTNPEFYGEKKNDLIEIANPLSKEMAVLRPTLLHTGLQSVAYNLNRKNSDLALFETGKTYIQKGEETFETPTIALFLTGKNIPENWQEKPKKVNEFYLKGIITGIKNLFRISESTNLGENIMQVHTADTALFNIKVPVYFAEFSLDKLVKKSVKTAIQIKEPPKFPVVRRDISMVLDSSIPWTSVTELVLKQKDSRIIDVGLFDIFEGAPLETGKKSFSIAFKLSDPEKTMTDTEIDSIMNKLIESSEKNLGALIRK